LLEPAHSRLSEVFEAWSVYWLEGKSRSDEPILSLKLDWPARQIHVVRAIHSYVWEGYDAGGNVILSRETTRWVRELVGTIFVEAFERGAEFLDEIICQLFQAVVGVSRLPLTSLEAPLPAFVLGRMAYFFQSSLVTPGPIRAVKDLIGHFTKDWAGREQTKLLEIILRATPKQQLSGVVALFVARWKEIGYERTAIPRLLRDLFEEISLSPYTDFVEKALAFVALLEEQGVWSAEQLVDFLSWLLRHIVQHLTAYDLATFHHRGANYPDVLLLDEVLKSYLSLIESRADLFLRADGETDLARRRKRMRRRALRQAWLLRRGYEGHPVPEAPTSPGENRRVLPFPHERIPEQQILHPETRTKRLYENDCLDRYLSERVAIILRQSISDLDHPEEMQELGMGLFLDRPLGIFKSPGEPDQTPLLSYQAFSRFIAEKRIRFLEERLGLLDPEKGKVLERELRLGPMKGFKPSHRGEPAHPSSVSLSDALKAAPDFVILRTTKKSVEEFTSCFHFEVLDPELSVDQVRLSLLIVREPSEGERRPWLMSVYDGRRMKRWELQVDPSQGYYCRAGIELPRAGLRLIRSWREDGQPIEIQSISVPIR
jgi:hypothetical protein